jgi:hypothetical protein
MPTLQLTQVYLEREQKKGLQARAKANGTKVAEGSLASTSISLDYPRRTSFARSGTRKVEHHLSEMAAESDRVNGRSSCGIAHRPGQDRAARTAR